MTLSTSTQCLWYFDNQTLLVELDFTYDTATNCPQITSAKAKYAERKLGNPFPVPPFHAIANFTPIGEAFSLPSELFPIFSEIWEDQIYEAAQEYIADYKAERV